MFGNSNWLVAINFVGRSNLGTMFAGISRQSFVAQKSMFGLKSNIASTAASMDALRKSAVNLGTALSGAFAGIGVAGMSTAVSDAAKLQQTLLSIKNETGATSASIGRFYNTAFAIANQNAMTPLQGGEMLRTISRLTARQFDVNKMMQVAPTVAGFASMVHFNRPDISVNDAARTGIQTAHLFRAYQPAALSKLLDSVYRLSGLMSETPDQALRQMSYYVPMFKMLGIGNETSIATMALLDRAGFRNKVGTNVRAQVLEAFGPLQLTKHAQAGHMQLLTDMGMFKNGKFAWNNPDGSLNYFGELAQIGTWEATQILRGIPREKIAQQMFSAFGKQGGTIAALFGDAQMMSILGGIKAYLGDPNVGLSAGGRNRDQNLAFQFTRATSNFTAVMTELGYPWLRDLTGFFEGLGDNLHGFQQWLHSHRDAEKQIGAVFARLTAHAGLRFTIGTAQVLMAGARAIGMLGAAAPGVGLAARAFTLLDGIFLAGMGGRVLGLATKFGVLSAATSTFASIMGGSAVAGVPMALRALGVGLLGLAGPITVAGAAIAGFMAITAKPVGTDEGTIRKGGSARTYGTQSFWEQYAKSHGWNAVPQDVVRELHHHQGTVNVHITIKADKDPHKTANIVASHIQHYAGKAGSIVNAPLGPGFSNAVPAAH